MQLDSSPSPQMDPLPPPQSDKQVVKIRKPPKVTVSGINDFNNFTKLITTFVGEDKVLYKALNNGNIIVEAKSEDTFRTLITELKKTNISYHTYGIKAEKPYRVVVRGLPPSTETNAIWEEFERKGHQPVKVVNIAKTIKVRNKDNQIIDRRHKAFPLFYVDLEPKDNNKDAYEIEHIEYCKVTVEPPHKNSAIPQCKRCQGWNHTKAHCHRPVKCFKCAGDHDSRNCKAKDPSKFKCANCSGNHSANYQGCNVYRQLEQSLRKQKPTVVQRIQQQPTREEAPKKVQTGTSYADTVRKTEKQNSSAQPVEQLNKEASRRPHPTFEATFADVVKALDTLTQQIGNISERLSKIEVAQTELRSSAPDASGNRRNRRSRNTKKHG